MRNISRLWISLLLLGISLAVELHMNAAKISTAQDDQVAGPLLDTSQHLPTNLKWSTDSQALIFTDIFDPQSNRWYKYEVATDTLIESDNEPILELSPLCAGFEEVSYDRISPDGQFLSYIESATFQNAEYTQYDLGIAGCQENRAFLIGGQRIIQPKRVLWSENSNSFVTVGWTNPDFPIQANLVSHYETNVSDARAFNIGALFQVDGDVYGVFKVYDLSADGINVLLSLGLDPREPRQLYLYNAQIPSRSRFLNEIDLTSIIAASFAPGDESKLWLFTPMQVIQYDLISEETTLIDDSLANETLSSMHRNNWALFSPDGRYLAVFTERGLFVLDLTEQAAQVSQNAAQSIITTPPQADGLLRLYLALECPSESGGMIVGHIFNPNPEAVVVRWGQGIYNDLLPQGELEVPGGSEEEPGNGAFEFAASDGRHVTPIFVDEVFHDARECFVPRPG